MNLDGLAEAALAMSRGSGGGGGSDPAALEDGAAAKAASLPREDGGNEVNNGRRYSTRPRKSVENRPHSTSASGSSKRNGRIGDRGSLAPTDKSANKMDPSINPQLYEMDSATFNNEDMAASAALQSFTSNSSSTRSGVATTTTPATTTSNKTAEFEAHHPAVTGDKETTAGSVSSSVSSTSERSSNHGDPPSTAQSTPDIGTSGSSAKPTTSSISARIRLDDPHMAVMSAGSAMARSNAAATAGVSSSSRLPPLNYSASPNLSSSSHTTPFVHPEDQDAASDAGSTSNHSASASGMPSTSSMQVPAKKQKGRRPNSATGESKNHKCPFQGCAWAFTRREHLKRHEKTHTQERPFTCDVPLCGLMFSRLDNLNSHKRTHEKGKRTAQWHVAKVVGGGSDSISPTDSSFPSLNDDDVIVPNLPPMPTAASHAAGIPPLASPTSTASVSSMAGAAGSTGRKRKRPPTQQKKFSYEEMSAGEEEDMDGEYVG